MLARVVGKNMSDNLGQSVIVENKPGANGMLGSSMVAKSAPDGYTLVVASPGNHAANASLYKEVPYDTIKDFTAVSQAVNLPMILVAPASLGVKTVAELNAKAKAQQGAHIRSEENTAEHQSIMPTSIAVFC